MESEVNKAKNLTEEEFRSCYPQISIQPSPKNVTKAQPVKSTPVKAVAISPKNVAKATPSPKPAIKTTSPVVSAQAGVKYNVTANLNALGITKALVSMNKTPAVTKSPVVRNQVMPSTFVLKSPSVTKTPPVGKPQVVTKTPVTVNKTVPIANQVVNKTGQPSVRQQVAGQVKTPGVTKQLVVKQQVAATAINKTQIPIEVALKQLTNVAKTPQKPPVTGAKDIIVPDQSSGNVKIVTYTNKNALQRPTNQLTIEKVDQPAKPQRIVLDANNHKSLQKAANISNSVPSSKPSTAETPAQANKIVVGTAQSTSQALPAEPVPVGKVSQQVTLYGPKGTAVNMDEFKKEKTLKQSAMTNVVSSTTNPTPAPVPTATPSLTAADQKKAQPPQRNPTVSQSPVRQVSRTAQKATTKPMVTKQYQSTQGQVKQVSPKRDVLPTVSSSPPPDLQLANEEEVTTSEIEAPGDGETFKMIVILPTGEKKNITLHGVANLDRTVQDILENADSYDGRDKIEVIAYTDTKAVESEMGEIAWDNTEKNQEEPREILGLEGGLEPGEIGKLSEVEKEENNGALNDGSENSEPIYREGYLAVCTFCGITSVDFGRCDRCKRTLPPDCKSIAAEKVQQLNRKTKADSLTGGSPKKKKVCRRRKADEPVCLTISDEDEELLGLAHNTQLSDDLNSQFHSDSSQIFCNDKEPVITDEMINEMNLAKNGTEIMDKELEEHLDHAEPGEQLWLQCRTVRIGSYKVVPKDRVMITPHGIKVTVPVINSDQCVDIKILFNEIIKVLIHFGRQCPVLFFYTKPIADLRIRRLLKMEDKEGHYYDTTSSNETHRRITFLPEKIDDTCKSTLKSIFNSDPTQRIFAELTGKEANDILVKTSPKEVQEFIKKKQPVEKKPPPPAPIIPPQPFNGQDIKTIMVYPPPPEKGGIPINTEDYACLDEDQFLNDVIIDFYLKYVIEKTLSPEDRARTHVFSSFFYNRLTTKPPGRRKSMNPVENDPNATPAVKRHSRVKSWTKNVDLFAKDFVVIPINENSHWFLAIVCFPGLTGPVRFSDNTPIDLPGRKKKTSNVEPKPALGSSAISSGSSLTSSTTMEVQDEGDRDEADGDDEKMDVPDEDEEQKVVPEEVKEELEEEQRPMSTRSKKKDREPIKQPSILIFDSLAGASRARVVATLRDYLRVEYETKHKDVRDFGGDVLKGTNVKCPQQTNYTDCGLYVLQYVEAFFQCPITDFHIPILQVQDWFKPAVVSRKRYEIQQLLHRLMEEQNLDIATLNLPLLNLRPESKLDYEDNEDDEEQMCEEEEEDEMLDDEEYHEEMEDGDMGEMEEGEYPHDDDQYLDPDMDHELYEDGMEEDMDDMEGMEEDEMMDEEDYGESEENLSVRPSSTGKSEGLKQYRIPRLTRKDNISNDDL